MNTPQFRTTDPRHRATLRWITAVTAATLVFAGYDLVAYGTVVPVLPHGFVSTYYDTVARAAGVTWFAGFGRLGVIGGPLVGGALMSSGLSARHPFYVFAGVAVVGTLVTCLVPRRSAALASAPAASVPGPLGGAASVLANE